MSKLDIANYSPYSQELVHCPAHSPRYAADKSNKSKYDRRIEVNRTEARARAENRVLTVFTRVYDFFRLIADASLGYIRANAPRGSSA